MSVTEKRTQIYLTAAQHDSIVRLARRQGRSVAAIIRDAVDRILEEDSLRTEVAWRDDPALGLVGAFELPSTQSDLNEAIDASVYDE